MTRPFKIGDLVRVITPHSDRYGQECTVTSELHEARRIKDGQFIGDVIVHDVDLLSSSFGIQYGFTPDEIEHVYDGDQLSSWEDCVFQPKILERVSCSGDPQ